MNEDIKFAVEIGDKHKGVDVIGKDVNETAENLQEMFDMDEMGKAIHSGCTRVPKMTSFAEFEKWLDEDE